MKNYKIGEQDVPRKDGQRGQLSQVANFLKGQLFRDADFST